MNKSLIVLVGPTAVGKTFVSIQLAKHFKTEIISADARQFFKELEIGTAKPRKEELQMVKHHLIDSHSIHDVMDAAVYATEATKIIDSIFLENNLAILCGGSGLYIKSLLEGFDEMPEVKDGVRESLNQLYKVSGVEALQVELKSSDPEYFEIVDRQNSQRLIRALEVIRSTGKKFSSFRNQNKKALPYQVIKVGLTLPKEILYQNIDARMDDMIAHGLFEEAKSLYPFRNLNPLQTVGYTEIFDFMDGKYDKYEAIRLLKQNTRHYAKRQLTWFKKDKEITWFQPNDLSGIIKWV